MKIKGKVPPIRKPVQKKPNQTMKSKKDYKRKARNGGKKGNIPV